MLSIKIGHFAAIGLCLYAIELLFIFVEPLTLCASQALIAITHCKDQCRNSTTVRIKFTVLLSFVINFVLK